MLRCALPACGGGLQRLWLWLLPRLGAACAGCCRRNRWLHSQCWGAPACAAVEQASALPQPALNAAAAAVPGLLTALQVEIAPHYYSKKEIQEQAQKKLPKTLGKAAGEA